ncbi:MAG: hypothetical protein RJA22_1499, partial [Verrucomicrobiota bacterium]
MHRLLPLALWLFMALPAQAAFRAGAATVDIAPTGFPVRVNAMFTERSATQVADPLEAKALALDDGTTRLVICVVDTCMMPRDLIDRAKAAARQATGLPTDRMLVSATHTHSAPSAMGCLGSRVDPAYAALLPGRIAAALTNALARLQPARLGWAQVDAPDLTHNRRWIRRPDRLLTDPFGQANVRAHMHPGHQSPDAIGPSGPVDPQLSVVALQTLEGRPLALLANFSMHYYGSPLLSSDYFGRFARHVATELQAPDSFIALLSQGTSGDLMWMDYSQPRQEIGYDAYARTLARRAAALVRQLDWRNTAPLAMAESTLDLAYRVPDERRLAWAREKAGALGEKLPRTQPEIYALEALELHARQRTELKLQAVRIGDLGLTALPNEVFALTGLKLKRQSPFPATLNIELANGAEGYIPPPEQHALGGYTTWPARTAGLETNAEPRIVEATLALLESVAGRPRRPLVDPPSPHSQAVVAARPAAFWRLEDMSVPVARDAAGGHDARYEPGVALYLDGIAQGRAVHCAGGRVRAALPLGDRYTVSLWVWNGLPHQARAVTGYFLSRGPEGDRAAPGEHLGIGGTHQAGLAGRLFLFNGNQRNEVVAGRSLLAQRAWHHVVLVRDGPRVRVHLDGRAEPEIDAAFVHTVPDGETNLFLGGRSDRLFGLEGKLDEVAVFTRALAPAEITQLHASAGLPAPAVTNATAPAAATVPAAPDFPPLSPQDALQQIRVREGYTVELAASEPLVLDPVAIDWSADGRLWVVEMADYPLGMDGAGKPGGRVRVL